ncbi:MAG: ABC transporter permease [Actinomycetota bacterium]|nr:ABC transporter permease [Actinomycetota bacterium]
MSGIAYTRYELRRAFRNWRFFLFSLGFPVVFYLLVALPQRNKHNFGGTGLSVPLYYMVGLAAFGTMVSMISTGARIAGERQVGWTRQLRISPLSTRAYFRAKVLTGYGMALSSLLLLYAAGVALGVSLPAQRWLAMTALILAGLLPFAALGILVGHLVTTDSVGPAIGGGVSIFAFLGGTWFPITNGFLHTLGQFLPSWWLVQASHVALDGHGWSVRGWITVAAWTALLAAGAAWAYRRDTNRV